MCVRMRCNKCWVEAKRNEDFIVMLQKLTFFVCLSCTEYIFEELLECIEICLIYKCVRMKCNICWAEAKVSYYSYAGKINIFRLFINSKYCKLFGSHIHSKFLFFVCLTIQSNVSYFLFTYCFKDLNLFIESHILSEWTIYIFPFVYKEILKASDAMIYG